MKTALMGRQPQRINLTKAVTAIALREMNASKRAALDAVAEAYMALCQVYVTHFCTVAHPDGYADYVYDTPLSDRWHRVVIQQAAGIAQSWRTNRRKACTEYLRKKAWYETQPEAKRKTLKPPTWTVFNLPTLHTTCIQANRNVVRQLDTLPEMALKVEPATDSSSFDLWLQIATLTRRKPIYVPVRLAAWHHEMLAGQTLNTSVTLHRDHTGLWWLTLSFDEAVEVQVAARHVAGDVGMAHYLTDSDGQHFGSFNGDLAARHEADRAKKQRKAKLRACLENKGITTLPSTSSATSQRLVRHIQQEINYAINQFFAAHPDSEVVLEDLSIAAMRFKARRMNARLKASQIGYLYQQLKWGAAKRGVPIRIVNPAYSSQECPRCHFTSRDNRPDQQTFCCKVCQHRAHADVNACVNLLNRVEDTALAECKTLDDIKHLLLSRHEAWTAQHGYP